MSELEKVIKELLWLIYNFPQQQDPKDEADKMCNAINTYCSDALSLLKAQMPRVMTVDEIKSDYVEIFYFETRAGMLRGCVKELSDLPDSSIVYLVCGSDDDTYWRDLDGYGITWRAWTRRPSPKQMNETPWEEVGR